MIVYACGYPCAAYTYTYTCTSMHPHTYEDIYAKAHPYAYTSLWTSGTVTGRQINHNKPMNPQIHEGDWMIEHMNNLSVDTDAYPQKGLLQNVPFISMTYLQLHVWGLSSQPWSRWKGNWLIDWISRIIILWVSLYSTIWMICNFMWIIGY